MKYDFQTILATKITSNTVQLENKTRTFNETQTAWGAPFKQQPNGLLRLILRFIPGYSRKNPLPKNPVSYGTELAVFGSQEPRNLGTSDEKGTSDETGEGHGVPTNNAEEVYGTKPHNVSKKIESFKNVDYEKVDRLSRADKYDFDSKTTNFIWNLTIHIVNHSMWVQALPIMLTKHALNFFQTSIQPKFDLDIMIFGHLVVLFRKKYNNNERMLGLMD